MNEIQNLAWSHVVAWAKKEVEDLRLRNDSTQLTPDQTAVVRGEIRALKKLLDLPATLAAQQSTNAPPGWPGGSEL